MSRVLDAATFAFDPLHHFWDAPRTKRTIAWTQVIAFFIGVVGIELNRRGLLPEPLARLTPLNHFYAIKLAFTLVLIQEVIDLVFVLPCSVSRAVGKQFEILALILLRNAFKELVYFPEPIDMPNDITPVLPILADAAGALLIFAGLGVYGRLHVSRKSSKSAGALYRFVATKKLIALGLLVSLAIIAVDVTVESVATGKPAEFFDVFYTVLIFTDILLVLIAHMHSPNFYSIFRNSGFALATLLIRLALASPRFYDALLGVCAMGFAICLTIAYNAFAPDGKKAKP